MVVLVIGPSPRWFYTEARARLLPLYGTVTINQQMGTAHANGIDYIYASSPIMMRGYTGVEVECWGPPPRGHDNVDWATQIAVVTRP